MKVGLCKNHMLAPHIAAGIQAAGDELVDYADTGCDAYIAWGWPMCKEVDRCIRGIRGKKMPPIVCVDRGMIDPTKRIFAVDGWGALGKYHAPRLAWFDVPDRAVQGGPVLVIGQVKRAQKRCGEVDQWDSPGYEEWVERELAKPNRKFREHPRVYNLQGHREPQATLEQDLEGCSGAIGWNSTAIIHARMLGYPVEGVEAHSMIRRFEPWEIAGLEWSLDQCQDGSAWRVIREVAIAGDQTGRAHRGDANRNPLGSDSGARAVPGASSNADADVGDGRPAQGRVASLLGPSGGSAPADGAQGAGGGAAEKPARPRVRRRARGGSHPR